MFLSCFITQVLINSLVSFMNFLQRNLYLLDNREGKSSSKQLQFHENHVLVINTINLLLLYNFSFSRGTFFNR